MLRRREPADGRPYNDKGCKARPVEDTAEHKGSYASSSYDDRQFLSENAKQVRALFQAPEN
jgi:hypothetical protein